MFKNQINHKPITWQRGEKRMKLCSPWRLSKSPLPTANTHVRSATTAWLGTDDTKRSLPIWIYGLLWTIPTTTVTIQDAFYSSLTEEDISVIDYICAQRAFNHFDMTDLGDYYNFCLLTDVLLLADILEKFRDVCLQHCFDPAHNYTSLGLSWQAALKKTDVELDLLTDFDQYLFIREGIKEGVAMISHQYTRANTLGTENYDASKRNSYIMYLDANNLYGWAMSQPLPASNFKWLTDEEMEELDVMMVLDDSPRGYILVCDLSIISTTSIFMYIS